MIIADYGQPQSIFIYIYIYMRLVSMLSGRKIDSVANKLRNLYLWLYAAMIGT